MHIRVTVRIYNTSLLDKPIYDWLQKIKKDKRPRAIKQRLADSFAPEELVVRHKLKPKSPSADRLNDQPEDPLTTDPPPPLVEPTVPSFAGFRRLTRPTSP